MDGPVAIVCSLSLVFLALFGIGSCCYYGPQYQVYTNRMQGEAELARAESNRKIATLEAKAKEESAKFLSQAEIIRAQGVAEANRIIGDSLRQNEGYLKYLWIQGMQTNQMQVVYVPTEANLPILESARWLEGKGER